MVSQTQRTSTKESMHQRRETKPRAEVDVLLSKDEVLRCPCPKSVHLPVVWFCSSTEPCTTNCRKLLSGWLRFGFTGTPGESPFHAFPLSSTIHLPSTTRKRNHIELGYSITRTLAPKDLGGRLWLNFALTTPELPCGLVTFPQITLILLPCRSLDAL